MSLPEIIYSDSDLLLVNKSPGLLSVPGKGPDKQDCLINRILPAFPGALVVHRLDQATSGLMIFALNRPAQRALGRQFEGGLIEKEYQALLEGVPRECGHRPLEELPGWNGIFEVKQRLDIENRPYQIVDPVQGKIGITEWTILGVTERAGTLPLTRIRYCPRTGRTHQLRLHSREMGSPIVGDRLYGREGEEDRMMLHACRIEFNHPESGERVVFTSPVPF